MPYVTRDAAGNIIASFANEQFAGQEFVAALPLPTLSEVQVAQNVILAAACRSAIEAGFASSALGAAHTYGCKATDQANINLAAVSGGGLWCADSTGAWAFTSHTAAQAQQVQKDMAAHIQAEQAHYAQQLAAVAAATTVSAVQAVVW